MGLSGGLVVGDGKEGGIKDDFQDFEQLQLFTEMKKARERTSLGLETKNSN